MKLMIYAKIGFMTTWTHYGIDASVSREKLIYRETQAWWRLLHQTVFEDGMWMRIYERTPENDETKYMQRINNCCMEVLY